MSVYNELVKRNISLPIKMDHGQVSLGLRHFIKYGLSKNFVIFFAIKN